MFLLFAILATAYAKYDVPHCDDRTVIVHLFEWKWMDIAAECERFLGPAGFCGVQVSPPSEHAVIPENGFPWWQRYQPVSYILESRSGNEAQFVDMINRCNAVGVRIIIDAVVNHMTGKGRVGPSSGGSSFTAAKLDFPAVPYSSKDFTPRDMCPSSSGLVDNYQNPVEVRNCYLVGLTDLCQRSYYVRQKISEYYNHVLRIGVMGFRVDASKHMWPGDLKIIQDMTNDLNPEAGFPASARPFFYHEVIDQGGEAISIDEYFDVGMVTEFRYGLKIANAIKDFSQLETIYNACGRMAPSNKAFIFVDNHDNQRDHGGGGNVLTYKNGRDYSMAVVYTLAQDYGFTRIMSSYNFDNKNAGPPGSNGNTDGVTINADETCGGGWVCEHRWASISRMIKFRNAATGTNNDNWYQEGYTVAFSRGNKGFFAMNKYGSLNMTLQTGLPTGTYCDVITDCAKTVTVNLDGTANIFIDNYDDPFVAICVGCDESGPIYAPIGHIDDPEPPITSGTERTIIFIEKKTIDGQDLFIRGGIDEARLPGSTSTVDITVNSIGTHSHYNKYNAWRKGDTKLDWSGAEVGQGTYEGQPAEGTPLVWTSNVKMSAAYQKLNTFGKHYWMVDVDMDCSRTENGWFELKAFLTNTESGWENNINQIGRCVGTAGGYTPYHSINHLGKCGFINVFPFNGPECIINKF